MNKPIKMNKIFILDETNGKSIKGKVLKELAERQGIKYFSNQKDLNNALSENNKDEY